ncbi:MAG TPA: hypothetical protein VJ483_03410 [Holophagaceae bacterium]|nr:hypothetical protein [Holophagaceae bacterium]
MSGESGTPAQDRWKQELEKPTEAFFAAFRAMLGEPEGERELLREAVKTLIPLVDWEAYLPHVPHGLLGLRAVLRLKPLLPEASFRRALATQVHAFAHEGRKFKPQLPSKGSGAWSNIELALARHKPNLAYGEMLGIEQPEPGHFRRVQAAIVHDMANMGHKAVMAHRLRELFEDLEHPKATGRRLLGLTAWLAATEPEDRFWAKRAGTRLEGAELRVAWEGAAIEDPETLVRELCDLGLVELLNRFTARLKAGAPGRELMAAMAVAAAEKQLDARRDLEGKTAWTFVYLATHAADLAGGGDPKLWCQAAAMVNLFPTDEEEGRVVSTPAEGQATTERLADAILDAEPAPAMGLAEALFDAEGAEPVLRGLAEAASQNDPAFNHSHQTLMVMAAADLAPLLPAPAQRAMLAAMAKCLANSQGSSDLGRLADRALSS